MVMVVVVVVVLVVVVVVVVVVLVCVGGVGVCVRVGVDCCCCWVLGVSGSGRDGGGLPRVLGKTLSGDGRGTLGWEHEGLGGSRSRQLKRGEGVQHGRVTRSVFRPLTCCIARAGMYCSMQHQADEGKRGERGGEEER